MGELIRHELATIFARGELQDPDLEGRIITVSEVRVSPDLRHATAYVSELGGGQIEDVLRGLKRCAKYLRGEIGGRMSTKNTPDFRFEPDTLYDEAAKMDALFDSEHVSQDLHANDDEDPGDNEGRE